MYSHKQEVSLPANKNITTYDGKVILFTNFHEFLGYAPYARSLATTITAFERFGIKWDYWQCAGYFHPDRAVNSALHDFINSDATDIIMIDADESWEAEGVMRLLAHPQEIVSGSYRMKNRWDEYVGVLKRKDGQPIGKMLPDGTALLEALRVPGGFVRIKKTALLKFKEHYKDLDISDTGQEYFPFFERIKVNGEIFSQDYAFSHRWIEMGGKLWIDPNLKISHWGWTEHCGDLDKHLRDKKKEQDAFDMVAKMASCLTS
jgi:hypothetical protein